MNKVHLKSQRLCLNPSILSVALAVIANIPSPSKKEVPLSLDKKGELITSKTYYHADMKVNLVPKDYDKLSKVVSFIALAVDGKAKPFNYKCHVDDVERRIVGGVIQPTGNYTMPKVEEKKEFSPSFESSKNEGFSLSDLPQVARSM